MGPFKDLEGHLRNDCLLTTIKCECDKAMAISQLATHLKFDCPLRSMPCAFCQSEFKVAELKSHEEVCESSPHVMLPCICGKEFARGDIDDHLEKDRGHLQLLMASVQSLQAQNKLLLAENHAIKFKNSKKPKFSAVFHVVLPVAAAVKDWDGPSMLFCGVDFYMQRQGRGLYIWSRPSFGAAGLFQVRISCTVNGKSVLSLAEHFRSDGLVSCKGKWEVNGLGTREFELPEPVGGYCHLKVGLVKEED